MVPAVFVTTLVLGLLPSLESASAGGIAALMRSASDVQVAVEPVAGQEATHEAIRALDLDGSGVVEKNEITKFAVKYGMRTEDALKDFARLDADGDGRLGADEVSGILDQDTSAPASAAAPSNVAAEKRSFQSTSSQIPARATAGLTDNPKTAEATAATQAGRMLAARFARKAATALQQRHEDDAKAHELENLARSLRGQAAKLAQKAIGETKQAAQRAASAEIVKEQARLQDLNQRASQAAQQALDSRARAKQALSSVLKAQADMDQQVKQLQAKLHVL